MSYGWPSLKSEVNQDALKSGDYLLHVTHSFRVRLTTFGKAKKKGPGGKPTPAVKATGGTIWVAKHYPHWQGTIMERLSNEFKQHNEIDNKRMAVELGKIPELKKYQKKVMPFVQTIKERIAVVGPEQGLRTVVDFDEMDVLFKNLSYLKSTLEVRSLKLGSFSLTFEKLFFSCR